MPLPLLPKKRGISHEDALSSEGGPADDDSCPDESEKLEFDVEQMAQEIMERRSTLPEQLKSTLASVLASQRPLVPEFSDIGQPEAPKSGASEQDILMRQKLSDVENPETAKKVQLLKQKISSNACVMPVVLKRMKECIARIEKLDSYNVIIHPAFKRKKTKGA
ncbi:uncharacterized protein LOC129290836 [Prosopis cineraria]|uniref:uncharacterized protein LOC129290836 n=1 Tax=Prosopis cineraria TaxID=364024 RepID=UPI0024107CDD|nr:uncharacterized protein LOC129290836 [Prosopis cineraria]